MPIPIQMLPAAGAFQQNDKMLAKSFDGLTDEEWNRRPDDKANSILWIAGHLVWARSRAVSALGSTWERPWLALFGRGAKPVDLEQYPSPEEVADAWKGVTDAMFTVMENATEELLNKPASPPSTNGKLSGLIGFLSWHETYHVGQIAYLRCWLGRGGIAG